ncbi:MAG: hypothetical protein NC343_02285 [Muribaculum sp.]|nr:hypothetical protein [Muribaculaceae bacterium]MCM1080556.1 hypothetical protein [Muribaculum sp.]
MDRNINKLIEVSYEIEGLLLLARQRNAKVGDELWQLIADKADALVYGLQCAFQEPDEEIFTVPSEATENKSEAEEQPAEEPAANDVYDLNELDIEFSDNTPTGQSEATEPDEPTLPDDGKPLEVVAEIEPDKNGYAETEETITLDEKLARDQSKCLRKAFSLNDWFRFRRELFGNSDTEFADAINLVEAMGTLAEANEYFYDDLQWDPDNPEVVDFMQIITKHFQSK